MNQWIVAAGLIALAALLLPGRVTAMKRWRKGRSGSVAASFATGMANAHDPARRMMVEEMEKRQLLDGEEADGDDEPVPGRG